MNGLILLKGNDIFTNSLIIADGTGNQHKNVKELILKYEKDFLDFGTLSVLNGESTGGRPEQFYQLSEEQAAFLMTLLRNSKKVVQFKKELVRQFYAMRKFILEKQSKEWIVTRYQGKLTRKNETDIIKKLVEYAQDQGSEHADKLYMTYSKLANKTAGVTNRNEATIPQLNNLSLIENIILHVIDNGIMADKHYKEIYQDCKKQLEAFKELAYLDYSA